MPPDTSRTLRGRQQSHAARCARARIAFADGLQTGMSEFFSMGGYGAFVWPAYAVSAVTLIGLAFVIRARAARARKRLAELEDRNG